MANLTLSIDDVVLRRARALARRDHTSVNALLREYLTLYVNARRRRIAAAEEVVALARRSHACSDRPWTRESLHER